jgi:hypothetical protein
VLVSRPPWSPRPKCVAPGTQFPPLRLRQPRPCIFPLAILPLKYRVQLYALPATAGSRKSSTCFHRRSKTQRCMCTLQIKLDAGFLVWLVGSLTHMVAPTDELNKVSARETLLPLLLRGTYKHLLCSFILRTATHMSLELAVSASLGLTGRAGSPPSSNIECRNPR